MTIYRRETLLERLETLLDHPPIPKVTATQFAKDFYGERLVRAFQRTKVDTQWPPALTELQTRVFLACLGHCFSLNDLEDCRRGQLGISECIREKYPDLMHSKKLSSKELELFLKIFRSPFEMLLGKPQALWEEIEVNRNKITGPEIRSMALTRLDHATQIRKIRDPQMFELSAAEALAKYAGYMKPETSVDSEKKTRPLMMTTPNTDGKPIQKPIQYRLAESLHAEGVHAYFWLPIYEMKAEAILIFRGTNGLQSLSRSCLDPEGIGKQAFEQHAPQIVRWLVEHAKRQPTDLLLCGHSLGGIDAQRLLVELIEQVVRDPDCPLRQIPKIRVRAFASPLLDQITASRYSQLLAESYKLAKRPSIDLICTQRSTDPVPRAGDFALSESRLGWVVDPNTRFNLHNAHSGAVFTNTGELTGGTFILVNGDALTRSLQNLLGQIVEEEADEGWVQVLPNIRALAEEFFRLQGQLIEWKAAQVGLRQQSSVIWVTSETINRILNFRRYISSLPLAEVARVFSSLLGRPGQPSKPR